jgi:hypothetical protein
MATEQTKLERIADLISDMNGAFKEVWGVIDVELFERTMTEYDDVVESYFIEEHGGIVIIDGLCTFESIYGDNGAWMWAVKYE